MPGISPKSELKKKSERTLYKCIMKASKGEID